MYDISFLIIYDNLERFLICISFIYVYRCAVPVAVASESFLVFGC